MFQNIQMIVNATRNTAVKGIGENMALRATFKTIYPSVYVPLKGNVRHVKRWLKPTLRALKERNKIFEEETDPKDLLEFRRRSNFIEWNRTAEIYSFGKRLHEDFDLQLLDQAFTHKSYLNKLRESYMEIDLDVATLNTPDNGELVVVGDEIISNHVWNYLAHSYPRFPREGIASAHQYLTNDSMMAYIAKELGTTHIILSQDYPVEEETYMKTFKAIIGALEKSQGVDRTLLLVRDLVITQMSGKDINDYLPFDDYSSILDGILKRDGLEPFEPRIIFQSGVNTILATYHVGVFSKKKLLGHGFGEDIETAIQMASLDALKRLFHTSDSSTPLKYDLILPYDENKSSNNLPINKWKSSKFNKTE